MKSAALAIPLRKFFDDLDSFAEAPPGVPKLRKFVLDLAARGKLVEQDENDELASAVLHRSLWHYNQSLFNVARFVHGGVRASS